MGAIRHSTDGQAPADRARHWHGVIAEAYFPLDLTFDDPDGFEGRLEMQGIGDVSLSRLRTAPLSFERRRRHIAAAADETFLVTIPLRAPVEFRQLGRDVRCDPGGFLVERGDEPYRFSYGSDNDLCVLKLDRAHLADRLRDPDRFCAQVFDARGGLGGLFAAMAREVERAGADGAGAVLGRHLVELLVLALDARGAGDPPAGSAVREAHRRRAEQVLARNLAHPDLSPGMIAEACGISKRYLHELFAEVNCTVAQRIREARLRAARDHLQMPDPGPLADVAYRFGFADQAQFSRLFKAMFGQTPSGYHADHGRRASRSG